MAPHVTIEWHRPGVGEPGTCFFGLLPSGAVALLLRFVIKNALRRAEGRGKPIGKVMTALLRAFPFAFAKFLSKMGNGNRKTIWFGTPASMTLSFAVLPEMRKDKLGRAGGQVWAGAECPRSISAWFSRSSPDKRNAHPSNCL
jgi:hypothetical protein